MLSTVYDRLLEWYNFSDINIFKNVSVLDIFNSSLITFNDLVNEANKLHVMFDGNKLYNKWTLDLRKPLRHPD